MRERHGEHHVGEVKKNVQEDDEKKIKSVKDAKHAKKDIGVVRGRDIKFINNITNKFIFLRNFN